MKVILIMDISVDGYIATTTDNVPWFENIDWDFFNGLMKQCGVVVMGHRTQEVSGDDFPYPDVLNIVMTRDASLLKDEKNVIFTNKHPSEIVSLAESRGFNTLLITGGVHPTTIASGIKLFENCDVTTQFRLLDSKQLNNSILQLHYSVEK